MPTLQDVAKLAGVSTATVSKVLSNTPYFTAATRDKVMRAVEALGYVPNLAARALSTGKTHIIAVVFPLVYDPIFADPHVLHILEGIEAECRQRGYNILLSTPRMSPDGMDEHYQQLIMSGYIDGVIALDNVPFASVLAPVRERHIPAVDIGYCATGACIRTDDHLGSLQIMRHVTGLGHKAIGVIGVPDNIHLASQFRSAGLREGAEEAGLNFDDLPYVNGDFSIGSGASSAKELLEQHPELTALICLNDRMAMGAIQQARQLGRSVPHDLTVVGYDDIPMALAFDPPLTTIDQQAVELGQLASRMLFELLDGHTPESVTLPPRLVIRDSSAEPQHRGKRS
jgi:LacI family repressor for deo operon, udp, cdd, tsx, nupC, and nupG